MKIILLLLATYCIALAAATTIADVDKKTLAEVSQWIKKYNKKYQPSEIATRLANFKATLDRVSNKNAAAAAESRVWGLNKYADLSSKEFEEAVLMKRRTPRRVTAGDVPAADATPPAELDWRTRGAVTPVKNQEQCGSCWAFSATENIESMWIRAGKATNSTLALSPQQIVDCDTFDGGCEGGDPTNAFSYVIQQGGLDSEASYPYTAEDGTCKFQQQDVVAKISNWTYATSWFDETTLQANLAKWGPLSICVDASYWQDYVSGVMGGWQCSWYNTLDHCVQLVGYNTTAYTPFWIVRNSWGTDWGEEGYIRLEMWENTCGLTNEATTSFAA